MTSWTTPKTWTGVALPSSEMNTYVRDNSNYAKERLSHYISLSSADVPVTNTITETNLFSYSVPGNEMTATGLMLFKCAFVVVNNKGTAGTHTIKFYVGANSITLFGGAVSVNNGTTNLYNIDMWIRGDGTTSSQRIGGAFTGYVNGVYGVALINTTEGTTATDITTSQTWKMTVTMNAASASFTTTGRFAGLTYNLATM